VQSLNYAVLSQFDLFTFWYLAALAFGIALFAKVPLKKTLICIASFFLFKLVVTTALTYFSLKLTGMGS
ncbi:MAG TPA: hypothetical protein PKK12_11645, partial [Candidatus Aminicenantes bacterium]|nr:hypothetical protein [Candidatus Aminicenantes bacterium]